MLMRYCKKCGTVYNADVVEDYDNVGFEVEEGKRDYKIACGHNFSDLSELKVSREC
jgi:rubredoxin